MRLSIIIVNYNVKYFLEHCLYSVQKAVSEINSEVFVVDNNSVDGSVAMIHEKFPSVRLIENPENVGFAKANNQAIHLAQGEYVLLLNPDTVVEETTFSKCISFMDKHPGVGALGPKMIDGKGKYLPESKRGLPSPETAFYKIFGFARLFPRSARFGRYYLGHTSVDEIQEVEILTGAFLFARRKVVEEIGLLDESFFMYGEDVDFSYRIKLAGYKLFYFPETTIIHYKGESVKKNSFNYVLLFYRAMEIFARKHFSSYRWYLCLIRAAIFFRAGLSFLKRGILRFLPFPAEAAIDYRKKINIAIVGFEDECERIKALLKASGIRTGSSVHVFPGIANISGYFSGTLAQLQEVIKIHHVDEVIFSAKDVSSQEIIKNMKLLQKSDTRFKIASPGSASVIGSNSKNASGDLYVIKPDHIH